MSMPGAFSPNAPSSPKVAPSGDTKNAEAFLTAPLRIGETSDAFSLHSTNAPDRFYDDDPAELPGDDDLPPLYTDEPSADGPQDPLLSIHDLQNKQHGLVPPHLVIPANGNEYHIDRRLDADPTFLQRHIEACAQVPPRAFVRLRGTHTEPVRRGDKTERQTHVDFDVRLELTPFLYSDIATHTSWRTLRTADNFAKVRRGTVFATRAPGFGGASAPGGVTLEEGRPGLAEWCHRYCASHTGLKTFQLRREVTGWNEELVRNKLENLVRATGYQGHVAISFPVQGEKVTVYNDARTNRWRLLRWLRIVCVFTLMIVLTWPWLFFRTARFEVAVAEWPMSRRLSDGRREYVSLSEEQWYNMWARAVRKAVLERRQGTLDQGDLVAAEGAQGAAFEGQTEDQAATGAVGSFLRAGVSAMNAVNVRFGWGGDH
ncbi:hypothetical protein ACHAQA_005192 [Verticillium albo-atrum]